MEKTREQDLINLKKSIRKNYKNYMNSIKEHCSYDEFLKDDALCLEVAFVKECHHFFISDMEYNYLLFKTLYDLSFIEGFNEYNYLNFYDFLVIKSKTYNSFNFQDWGELIDFFVDITNIEI